jgi:antitoxin HicB
MRANPQADWTIADVERLCRDVGLTITPPRLALQSARSGERHDADDSGASAHPRGVHSSADRVGGSISRSERRKMIYRYRIALRPLDAGEGGGWLAEVPELPGCMSDGETPQEAIDNVMDAIACWIEAAEEDGRPVPAPAGADAA